MPINARCGMADLKAALLAHLPTGRTVLVEYILMAGVNDALADAALLLDWLQGLPVRLNLIPANPGPDPALTTPSPEAVFAFQKYLLDRGIRTLVRHPHGRDIGGACGQLAGAARIEGRGGEPQRGAAIAPLAAEGAETLGPRDQ
jgi:23S rRNA (adenine2503-C2)-methyltransferase